MVRKAIPSEMKVGLTAYGKSALYSISVNHFAFVRTDMEANQLSFDTSQLHSAPYQYTQPISYQTSRHSLNYWLLVYFNDFDDYNNYRDPHLGSRQRTKRLDGADLLFEGKGPGSTYTHMILNRMTISYLVVDYSSMDLQIEMAEYAQLTFVSLTADKTQTIPFNRPFFARCSLLGMSFSESYINSASIANYGYNVRHNLIVRAGSNDLTASIWNAAGN